VKRGWRQHEEALDELRAAAEWYEDRSAGLGTLFLDAVENAVESVLDPTIGWGFYQGQRRSPQPCSRSVAGFPFDVVFFVSHGEVVIVAYAHERRRPGYWTSRLQH
jgi:toxin ParE1/3/4